MQIHACMLALDTGRTVKMMYNREESFFGHVHRHPCNMRYEHGATRDGELVYVKARIVFDGGAYASSSTAVCGERGPLRRRTYECPNALIDALRHTDNPPCGAMRGFGAVQTCFAYESQMDKLAEALRMDPVGAPPDKERHDGGHSDAYRAEDRGPPPVAELLERIKRPCPCRRRRRGGPRDLRELPGGVSNTTHGEGVKRGVGYAVGFKNIGFSEGFDDYATARVRLSMTEEATPLRGCTPRRPRSGRGW